MNRFISTICLALFAAGVTASADTNIALNSNGGVALFGFNNTGNSAVTGTLYDHAGSSASLNDGQTTTGGTDDTFGQSNPSLGFIGATFVLSPTMQVNSVVFYGANFSDGGWFGVNGRQADGTAPMFDSMGHLTNQAFNLTSAGLIAPSLQYTTDGGVTWINDANVTNDYVTQFTGAVANGGSPTNPATFTLTVPLTGINGLRLIGQDGGYASGGGGFLGAREIEVFSSAAVPEPSTWAMLFGGLFFLGWMGRFRVSQK